MTNPASQIFNDLADYIQKEAGQTTFFKFNMNTWGKPFSSGGGNCGTAACLAGSYALQAHQRLSVEGQEFRVALGNLLGEQRGYEIWDALCLPRYLTSDYALIKPESAVMMLRELAGIPNEELTARRARQAWADAFSHYGSRSNSPSFLEKPRLFEEDFVAEEVVRISIRNDDATPKRLNIQQDD